MSSSTSRSQDGGSDRREKKHQRWGWWSAAGVVVALVITVVTVSLTRVPDEETPSSPVRDDAATALAALATSDLETLGSRLALYRGRADFAYYFTAQTTPRLLGDALGSVAGEDAPLDPEVDADQYDLTLTDLAGTLALASHGTDDRALPPSWTTDFITATTEPLVLYPASSATTNDTAAQRADQDTANKQNLLLLLSRGYWSTDFLKTVTTAYVAYDDAHANDGWTQPDPVDADYAPSPNGTYLSDGILALTAALTANPTASLWAFTEFRPGTQSISFDDADHPLGNFTHYLFFEHDFPTSTDSESEDDSAADSVGMTATLTALSSAIDADPIPIGPTDPGTSTPRADVLVLQALAQSLREDDSCTWDPRDIGHCVEAAAEAVWHFAQHWGHLALDILSLAAYAPPPWQQVGQGAAVLNATWYAIDGDYAMAGLSLAVVSPSLDFTRIFSTVKASVAAAKGVEVAAQAEKAAQKSALLTKIAQAWRSEPWRDCSAVGAGGLKLDLVPTWTRRQKQAAIAKVEAYYNAVQLGLLRKTPVHREVLTATARYRQAGGTVKPGEDVDHTIDLQLGGSDDLTNMKPLDASVNRSLGIQVARQIQTLANGAVITSVAIC